MDNSPTALTRKQLLYKGLSDINDDNDEAPDTGRLESAAKFGGTSNTSRSKPGLGASPLPRAVSDADLAAKATMLARGTDRTAIPATAKKPALLKGATFSGASSKAMVPKAPAKPVSPTTSPVRAKATGKRKRDAVEKRVPEHLQIFKDLHFYFFPNNGAHPARKLRIAKAVEFGATWHQEWSNTVTHIIADKAFDYATILKFLKMDSVPARVTVVSEVYPSECISYRALLKPDQRFRVQGYDPLPDAARPTTATSVDSDRSLELKPAGKSVMARQPDTPRTEEHESVDPMHRSLSPALPDQPQARNLPREENAMGDRPSRNARSTIEFDALIKQARDNQYLDADDDDEADSRPTSKGSSETDDEEAPKPSFALSKKRKSMTTGERQQERQSKFSCMQKHTGDKAGNPNAATIEILQQMATYYDQLGDQWRTRAYRQAMSALRNYPTKVWTEEEALCIPKIGARLAKKIQEIACTKRLRRLDNARAEPADQVLQTFMQVYGAGFAQASKWISLGFTTLDEVLEKGDVTENQRIGIEHFADFNSRIPRAEVEQHGNIVRKAVQKMDPAFEVIVGGSYRRGAKDSGDIDCIITHPTCDASQIRQIVLDQLVPKLMKSGFLVAGLATTNEDKGSKWHGASCLPSATIWRRIDLLLVPADELGAALIYFTGNDIFNRSLRLLASTKKMRLNQRGLYKGFIRGANREKLTDGELVEGKDEKKIFAALGVPWRPPEHRIC